MNIGEVAKATGITAKMIRRHPHVFGDAAAATAEQVTQHWDHAKRQEKQRNSALDGIPLALPALARTARLTAKAARAGASSSLQTVWESVQQAVHDLAEEIAPLTVGRTTKPAVDSQVGAERIGALLFAVANLARQLGINPEDALRESNVAFEENFRRNEQRPGWPGLEGTPETPVSGS